MDRRTDESYRQRGPLKRAIFFGRFEVSTSADSDLTTLNVAWRCNFHLWYLDPEESKTRLIDWWWRNEPFPILTRCLMYRPCVEAVNVRMSFIGACCVARRVERDRGGGAGWVVRIVRSPLPLSVAAACTCSAVGGLSGRPAGPSHACSLTPPSKRLICRHYPPAVKVPGPRKARQCRTTTISK